jgi:hypothetical protein
MLDPALHIFDHLPGVRSNHCRFRCSVATPSWVENPYFQYFCGEEFFQRALVLDHSSLTRWRQRMGQEKLKALLLQESGSDPDGRDEALRPRLCCHRYDGAAEGGDVSDRRQAAQPGARAAGAPG